MSAIPGRTIQRRARAASIVLLVFLVAACTGGTPESGSDSTLPSPTPSSIAVPTQSPSPPPKQTSPTPHPEPRAPENSGLEPFGLSDAVAERIDRRLTMGRGYTRGVGTWTVFLYSRGERVGVGFRIGDREPTMACCLARLHSPARPLAYIPIRDLGGFVLAHIDPNVARVRFDCIQCSDATGFITHIVNGRLDGIPQLALVFIRPNADGGNDGYLVTLDSSFRRVDRDRVGLPPACSGPPCPNGLAWGSLELGTETFFGP